MARRAIWDRCQQVGPPIRQNRVSDTVGHRSRATIGRRENRVGGVVAGHRRGIGEIDRDGP
jgi:hypothetical protein